MNRTAQLVLAFRKAHATPMGMVTDKDLKWAEDRLWEEIESHVWCAAFDSTLAERKPERECHKVADAAAAEAHKNRDKLLEEALKTQS